MGSNRLGAANSLIEAIRANSLHRVASALDDNADIETPDIHGYRGLPLRTACFVGNVPIVRELIRRGADLNAPTADGPGAPIRLAMRAGHTEIAALLLAHNAQIPFDLEIPPSIFERAKELSSGNKPILDMPMLEFDVPPAKPAGAPESRHDSMVRFITSQPKDAIEQVDMKGVYGVDTSVLALDFERSGGAWEKTDPTPPASLDDEPK
ncbi:ankyrin repeat domain-containing protein [Azonexus sp.]|uniref:ankyrin repeat domain-containing protein n=1 Tax=Azonexus sp. TaxID=1872668 RepID=UPI0035B4D8A8